MGANKPAIFLTLTLTCIDCPCRCKSSRSRRSSCAQTTRAARVSRFQAGKVSLPPRPPLPPPPLLQAMAACCTRSCAGGRRETSVHMDSRKCCCWTAEKRSVSLKPTCIIRYRLVHLTKPNHGLFENEFSATVLIAYFFIF